MSRSVDVTVGTTSIFSNTLDCARIDSEPKVKHRKRLLKYVAGRGIILNPRRDNGNSSQLMVYESWRYEDRLSAAWNRKLTTVRIRIMARITD